MSRRSRRREGNPVEGASGASREGRGVAPFVYAALDVVFAALYLWLGLTVARTVDGTFEIASVVAAIGLAVAGVGTALRTRKAWWVGVGGCALVLAMGLLLIALLAWSAGILAATFGAMGKAGALGALAAAALAIEVYVLLPALQLGYLLGPRGRLIARRDPG